jgi:16S rRNA (uracil1498-N3)-methyltransferase
VTPRLHLPRALRPGLEVELDRDLSHYVLRVLRLRTGDPVQVFDGAGARHAATVAQAGPRQCVLRVGEPLPSPAESPLPITLAQCVSTGEKMDWTIEKAVELGAAEIVPLQSSRSVVRLDEERARRRAAHWERLVVAACMQCGRDRLPALRPVRALAEWLATAPADGLRLVLAPGAAQGLGSLPAPAQGTGVVVLVGPESGLSDDEVALARAAGFVPVSLGPRILRTETAGLAALAALQARFGDLR